MVDFTRTGGALWIRWTLGVGLCGLLGCSSSGALSAGRFDGGASGEPTDTGNPVFATSFDAGGSDAQVADSGAVASTDASTGTRRPSTGSSSGSQPCGSVAHGTNEERVRYQSEAVAQGSTCMSETQTRTCQNGTFSAWTGTFTHETCEATNRVTWCRGIPASEGFPLSTCSIKITRCANNYVLRDQTLTNFGANVDDAAKNCETATRDCVELCGPGSSAVGMSRCGTGTCSYDVSN